MKLLSLNPTFKTQKEMEDFHRSYSFPEFDDLHPHVQKILAIHYPRLDKTGVPGLFTAIKTFKEDLYQLCIDKIGAGEQSEHFKELLWKLKKISTNEALNVELAKEYPIGDLAVQLGIEVRLNQFKCHLHADKTASAHLYHKTNSWYCFGCHKGGDTIDLVRGVLGLRFPEAVKYLTI